MLRVTAIWTGVSGGPGYSTFYFNEPLWSAPAAQASVAAVRAFFFGFVGAIPGGVTIQVQSAVGVVDVETGDLVDEQNVNAVAAVVGGANAPRAAPAGAVVSWRTGMIIKGRRLRGRTFLVPLASAAYDNDGSLTDSVLALIRGSANALAAPPSGDQRALGIWHRPKKPTKENPDQPVVIGAFAPVTGASVPDKAAVLRSRR